MIHSPWLIFWAVVIILASVGYIGPLLLIKLGWVSRADGKHVASYLIAATVVIAIAAGFFAIASDNEFGGNGSKEAASLTALGLLAGGVLIGFLFALPKVVDATAATTASDPTARLRANTNLEKVSDWLTTVITGLALTQIARIPDYLNKFSNFLAGGLANHDIGKTVAVAAAPQASLVASALGIAIHFPIVGFLAGYIATRTILTRAFDAADRGLIDEDKKKRVDNTPQLMELPDLSSDAGATNDQIAAAKAIASVDPSTLGTTDEKASYARALTILGRPHDAVPWFQQALGITPNDQRLLEQYAAALYADPQSDSWEIVPILKRALSLVKPDDSKSRERISTNLVLSYLYVPDGFVKALSLANQMDADPTIEKRPILFYYRACALGQLYDALKVGRTFNAPIPNDIAAAKSAIYNDTTLAVRLQPTLKARFFHVTTPHPAEAGRDEPEDTDLLTFAQDNPDYAKLFSS